MCAITSNLKLAQAPGNVLLAVGEANLPKQSVVNISQLYTVDKQILTDKIGTLSWVSINQVIQGIYTLLDPLSIKE